MPIFDYMLKNERKRKFENDVFLLIVKLNALKSKGFNIKYYQNFKFLNNLGREFPLSKEKSPLE